MTVDAELASGLLGELRLADRPPDRPWFALRSSVGPVREIVEAFVAFLRPII